MSKKQWKNVTENLSLQFSTKGAWSAEEVENPTDDVNVIRSILPTKTSATRQKSDLENISQNGPFLLNFGNIPFEASETDLKNFFRAYEIMSIIKNEHRKGTGMIEFKDFASLAGALNMGDKVFISRPIRLSIGTKDDLARLQGGAGTQRNRFQNNQTRAQPSTAGEDSDNWRVRKSHPVPQEKTENFSPNKERSNWRERQTIRVSDEKVPVEEDDNWRRPKANETKAPIKDVNFSRSMPETSKSPVCSEKIEPIIAPDSGKDQKKPSIFGEAKPVDTTAKDLEIEKKIESKKIAGDEPKLESAQKPNAWATKKPSNPPVSATPADKSGRLEWREQRPNPIRSKVNSENARESPAKQEPATLAVPEPSPKKPEPVPAPPPANNVWADRMKSKGTPALTQAQAPAKERPIEQNNNAPRQLPVEIVAPTLESTVSGDKLDKDKSTNQKPPVVISVNGPFLNPKSRTPHHSMSDSSNKTPTAVPVNKDQDQQAVKPSYPESKSPAVKTCSTQSSWSKGPPRGLIEKAETNQ